MRPGHAYVCALRRSGSSIGRAAVSKTVGCGFNSHPERHKGVNMTIWPMLSSWDVCGGIAICSSGRMIEEMLESNNKIKSIIGYANDDSLLKLKHDTEDAITNGFSKSLGSGY